MVGWLNASLLKFSQVAAFTWRVLYVSGCFLICGFTGCGRYDDSVLSNQSKTWIWYVRLNRAIPHGYIRIFVYPGDTGDFGGCFLIRRFVGSMATLGTMTQSGRTDRDLEYSGYLVSIRPFTMEIFVDLCPCAPDNLIVCAVPILMAKEKWYLSYWVPFSRR